MEIYGTGYSPAELQALGKALPKVGLLTIVQSIENQLPLEQDGPHAIDGGYMAAIGQFGGVIWLRTTLNFHDNELRHLASLEKLVDVDIRRPRGSAPIDVREVMHLAALQRLQKLRISDVTEPHKLKSLFSKVPSLRSIRTHFNNGWVNTERDRAEDDTWWYLGEADETVVVHIP